MPTFTHVPDFLEGSLRPRRVESNNKSGLALISAAAFGFSLYIGLSGIVEVDTMVARGNGARETSKGSKVLG